MQEEIKTLEDKLGENCKHSVLTVCWDCNRNGTNMPKDTECGNCGSNNTIRYYDIDTIREVIKQIT